LAYDAVQASGDVGVAKWVGGDERIKSAGFQLVSSETITNNIELCLPREEVGLGLLLVLMALCSWKTSILGTLHLCTLCWLGTSKRGAIASHENDYIFI
jgi:hypothetical protein